MKYEILFIAPGNGVWTRHETLDQAQSHVRMLSSEAKQGTFTWSIFHSGELISSSKVK